MYFSHHHCTRYSSEVAEHCGVDASSFGPKLYNPKEISENSEVRNIFLDVCIA